MIDGKEDFSNEELEKILKETIKFYKKVIK